MHFGYDGDTIRDALSRKKIHDLCVCTPQLCAILTTYSNNARLRPHAAATIKGDLP